MRRFLPLLTSTAALALILPQAACAQMQGPALGLTQQSVAGAYQAPNSIQPETTLSISAQATVKREPDIAYINAGVQAEGETATAAMESQAEAMTGVFDALEKAGVAKKDMQTSNFSLWPRYTYIETKLKDGSSRGRAEAGRLFGLQPADHQGAGSRQSGLNARQPGEGGRQHVQRSEFRAR
jgi:uncharacterized protein YggE